MGDYAITFESINLTAFLMKFFYLVSGLAWPIAIVWISYQFKTELRALLNRLAQPKNKDGDNKDT